MASTIYSYFLEAGRTKFPVSFEYLARRFVKVTLVGEARRELVLNVDYRFTSKMEIETTVTWIPGTFTTIEVRRVTSSTDRLVNFTDGSILRSQDLNVSQIQAIHIAEEARDISDSSMLSNGTFWDALGLRITNVATPANASDGATKEYVDSQSVRDLNRTMRVPSGEQIASLPAAIQRASKVLTFDSAGNPQAVAPVSGSATELAMNLRDPALGASMVGYMQSTLKYKLGDFASITDHKKEEDGLDWAPAFRRALAVNPRVFFPCRPDVDYVLYTVVEIPEGGLLLGEDGAILRTRTATDAAGTVVSQLLDVKDTEFFGVFNITFDGGVREIMTLKSYKRPIRVQRVKHVIFGKVTILNNPDWSVSFESCDNVVVNGYTQRSYVYINTAMNSTRGGGRDGIHFMDCYNVVADDLDIESGDDCVGITSQLRGCKNVNITRLRGTSVIASLVIYNEEHELSGSGKYVAMPMVGLYVSDAKVKPGGTARNVVRVAKYNPLSVIRDVSIESVRGTSYNSGTHLSGIDVVRLRDVDTESTLQHGVAITDCNDVQGEVRGKSLRVGYDGINLSRCSLMYLIAYSTESAGFGIHLLSVTESVVIPFMKDCGGSTFATSNGGGARMVNCVDVEIPYGILKGLPTISYYGIITAGNTNCRVGKSLGLGGYIPRHGGYNSISIYQEPTVAVRLKENNDGTLALSGQLYCTVERVSLGVYRFTFDKSMRSTQFPFDCTAVAVNDVRIVKMIGAPSPSSITLSAVDLTGAPKAVESMTFMAYDI